MAPAMSSIPTQIPDPISAGTTVVYRRSYADYPATGGWGLTLHLRGAATLNQAATVVDGVFEITIPATSTDDLTAGVYQWVERVTKAGEVRDAARGTVTVLADIATAGAGALQSAEEKELALVNAAIAELLSTGKTIVSYQVHGRAARKEDLKTLYEIRSKLQAAVAQQKSGHFGRQVRVRFPGMGAEV